ncbi:Aste57867_7351 [Aphanomyces stellatus]|uniref:Aste57867_7143 protein n=1 Tax=Aphanomyces stellatus TaxID=120398 RepID=A0A485KI72_9STRA|nr:hypothetical protein As57867_007325 [Aphanomyces stellatus]KAF0704740.1 hypothetical protein As57867_007247 [Aphanomyces stellatus]KAF0705078.1 hypothetical protein As57867_007119 [Aphanomyces stellatus]VFT84075.1 Aste57867_7143 [Aphanomyces stellatus]VFT84193.1 Aste57867_7272 [Aphanomyces stellatus]
MWRRYPTTSCQSSSDPFGAYVHAFLATLAPIALGSKPQYVGPMVDYTWSEFTKAGDNDFADDEATTDSSDASSDEAIPEYNVLCNAANTHMWITVSTPRFKAAQGTMEIEVMPTTLCVVVAGVYRLELELPWAVSIADSDVFWDYFEETQALCLALEPCPLHELCLSLDFE